MQTVKYPTFDLVTRDKLDSGKLAETWEEAVKSYKDQAIVLSDPKGEAFQQHIPQISPIEVNPYSITSIMDRNGQFHLLFPIYSTESYGLKLSIFGKIPSNPKSFQHFSIPSSLKLVRGLAGQVALTWEKAARKWGCYAGIGYTKNFKSANVCQYESASLLEALHNAERHKPYAETLNPYEISIIDHGKHVTYYLPVSREDEKGVEIYFYQIEVHYHQTIAIQEVSTAATEKEIPCAVTPKLDLAEKPSEDNIIIMSDSIGLPSENLISKDKLGEVAKVWEQMVYCSGEHSHLTYFPASGKCIRRITSETQLYYDNKEELRKELYGGGAATAGKIDPYHITAIRAASRFILAFPICSTVKDGGIEYSIRYSSPIPKDIQYVHYIKTNDNLMLLSRKGKLTNEMDLEWQREVQNKGLAANWSVIASSSQRGDKSYIEPYMARIVERKHDVVFYFPVYSHISKSAYYAHYCFPKSSARLSSRQDAIKPALGYSESVATAMPRKEERVGLAIYKDMLYKREGDNTSPLMGISLITRAVPQIADCWLRLKKTYGDGACLDFSDSEIYFGAINNPSDLAKFSRKDYIFFARRHVKTWEEVAAYLCVPGKQEGKGYLIATIIGGIVSFICMKLADYF